MNFSKLLPLCMLLGVTTVGASPAQLVTTSTIAAAATTSTAQASTSTLAIASTTSSAPVSSPTSVDAATNYRITVINNSGDDNNYGIFLDSPAIATVPDKNVWTNVWVYQRVASTGSFTLNVLDTFYAWIGQAAEAPVPGVIIQGGVGQAVSQLGSGSKFGSTFSMTNDEGIANFVLPNPTASALNGSFQINTDTTFTSNNLFMLGLGAVNPLSGIIVPAGVISALPDRKYNLSPIVKFYISAGVWQPGEIVDIEFESDTVGVIDFSSGPGLGNFGCNIVQGSNGEFTATYTSK